MMRLSVERLRWLLIASGSLVVLALVWWIGMGRYRALRNWQKILEKSGATVTRDTNGVTYSQSVQGKTIFTLHARKAVNVGDGKWSLHDGVLTLYGRQAGRADRIYGSDIEYDEKTGVAHAIGEVHMDLQAPSALASAGKSSPHGLEESAPSHAAGEPAGNEDADIIHVRTSSLIYMRKLDVAATDQDVEFVYRGVKCNAKGAEFNSGQGILHLLADVRMQTLLHEEPVDLTAKRADMDRSSNVIQLQSPVVRSMGKTGMRTGSAEGAVLYLRKDGSLESATAQGNVVLRTELQTVTGARLDASFDSQTVPQKAALTGGVKMTDTSATRPLHGTAQDVHVVFDSEGSPEKVMATRATLQMSERAADGQAFQRQISGDRMTAKLVPVPGKGKAKGNKNAQLKELDVVGSAKASGDSMASQQGARGGAPHETGARSLVRKTTSVGADELVASFTTDAQGRAVLQQVNGKAHTQLQQNAADGARQDSAGDTLLMTFAAPPTRQEADASLTANGKGPGAAVELVSAVQNGHVVVHSLAAQKQGAQAPQLVTATAAEATYTAAAERVELTGGAHMVQGSMELQAAKVALDTASGDADASGAVAATVQNGGAGGNGANDANGANKSLPTHILADRGHFAHATQIAEFDATDARPAKMWQGPSQVEAAKIVLDGVRHTMTARPAATGALVHAVFAQTATGASSGTASVEKTSAENTDGSETKRAHGAGSGTTFVSVFSAAMDYSDVRREAVFAGKVHIEGTLGQAHSDRAVVVLEPAAKGAQAHGAASMQPVQPTAVAGSPFSGSVQRVVLLGGVAMEQPGRRATGEQLTYTAATGNYVLTGTAAKPPVVVDAEHGNVTGTTLLFGGEGSNIVVAGQQSNGKSTADRVRTEIVVKPRQ